MTKKWRNDPITEPQRKFLVTLGYTGECPATKGNASALIDKLKVEASLVQSKHRKLVKEFDRAVQEDRFVSGEWGRC